MTNFELIKALAKRLKKFSWVIAIVALLFGGLLYFVAKQGVRTFTSKATVFPLNSSSENTISTSTIGNILGLADAPRSFSGEAAINIVELAGSRRTREAVVLTRLPEFNNKRVAEVMMEEHNKHTGYMQNEPIKLPLDSARLINLSSNMLQGGISAKINKNGILELFYTNTNPEVVRAISYVFIDKISEFYVDLKKKKAQIDFEFAVKKADSLKYILDALDRRAIQLDETTYFTNEELKRYSLPKINLMQDKQTIQSQYYYAVNNREAAAYKLQKETPIIETLDKPEGPYTVIGKSTMLYVLLGLLLGVLIGVIGVSWKIISNYLGQELDKAIEKAAAPKANTPVANNPQPEAAKTT
jgi:uncharacterized protein involved in exopolysaccharide biosynthesis